MIVSYLVVRVTAINLGTYSGRHCVGFCCSAANAVLRNYLAFLIGNLKISKRISELLSERKRCTKNVDDKINAVCNGRIINFSRTGEWLGRRGW